MTEELDEECGCWRCHVADVMAPIAYKRFIAFANPTEPHTDPPCLPCARQAATEEPQ